MSDDKTLTLESRVENSTEAVQLSRAELRKKNEKEKTAELELMGHPSLVSGSNIELAGFGQWDGKYAIVEAHHLLKPGYTVRLKIRKTLEG